jgi:hypothetical protein
MTQKKQPDVPEDVIARMEALMEENRLLRKKEDFVRKRMVARTAILRQALNEHYEGHEVRVGRIRRRRDALREEFEALWREHLPGQKRVVLPTMTVSKRHDTTVTILDKEAVIDALDRLDRLDLVEQVIDEKGLRSLVTAGKLKDLPEDALKVEVRVSLQTYTRKDG